MPYRIIWLLAAFLSAISADPVEGQEYLWCFEGDDVLFDLNPQTNLLTIEHRAAMYNCCPEPVVHQVAVLDRLITVTEWAGIDSPCDCICCFDLKVEMGEIPAGYWTVQFHWWNEETGTWLFQQTEIVIPEHIGHQVPQVVFQEISDCLESSGVPEPPERTRAWGALKSWYWN